jgi:hypothetical protein
MILPALFDPLSIAVLVILLGMIALSLAWYRGARSHLHEVRGALRVLRRVAGQLAADHPIRKRLEAAPVVDLAFEEIARLLSGDRVEPDARALAELPAKIAWIERFAQYAVHLGILGTVFALVSSDPTDLQAFRASLPTALGTTFWGLVGALALSSIAGVCDTLHEHAKLHVREALLAGLESPAEGSAG